MFLDAGRSQRLRSVFATTTAQLTAASPSKPDVSSTASHGAGTADWEIHDKIAIWNRAPVSAEGHPLG